MSWQAYVDNNLIGSGQITQAGIYGIQGGQWAASPNFNVSIHFQLLFIISRGAAGCSSTFKAWPGVSLAEEY